MNNKIKLHQSYTKKLQEEFSVSDQTIRMSLQYVFNSETAKAIRKRAKELLINEANQIKTEN